MHVTSPELCCGLPETIKAERLIRRWAKRQHLKATSRTKRKPVELRLWWFADENNLLASPEVGLDDEEATEWLLS